MLFCTLPLIWDENYVYIWVYIYIHTHIHIWIYTLGLQYLPFLKMNIFQASLVAQMVWPQDWKRSGFIPIPKKGNAKECTIYPTIALISHVSKVMLKILQARLQQYVNHELTDVQAGFRKGRATRDQIANICWVIKKARDFERNIYFCFIDYTKTFDCVDHNKRWTILKDMRIPDHLTCLLRNLYAGQEAT